MAKEAPILNLFDDFDFTELSLVNPISLAGGSFFTKLKWKGEDTWFIQAPICTTKNGFVKTSKKITCDLLFEKSNTSFIEWLENLESCCVDMIYAKSQDWFQDEITKDDIESAFTSCLRSYKSGSFYLIKTSTESPRMGHNPNTLSIYDQQEREAKIDDVSSDSSMITVLQLHGVRFTPKNFQIFIQLKQVMLLNDNMFKVCQIKPSVDSRPKNKISLKSREVPEDDDNEEEIINETNNNTHVEDVDEVDIEKTQESLVDTSEETVAETKEDQETLEKEEEESKTLEEENNNEIEEFEITCDDDNLETMVLKKPDEVYLDIYREARKTAREAKKATILQYLELQKLRSEYTVEGIDDSDDDIDKALFNETKKLSNTSEEEVGFSE